MKHSLSDLISRILEEPHWNNYSRSRLMNYLREWEKRQRWFLNPVNIGSWLRENADAKSMGELFERFIKTEVLGE